MSEVEVRRGDVFWLLYGAGNGSYVEQAKRPIIIVSSDKGNETSPLVLGVPTTTKSKYGVICPEITSAYKSSWALCNQVGCFEKSRLGDYIYTLSDEEMAAVDRGLCVVMSLFPNRDEEAESEREEEIKSLNAKIADLTNQLAQQKLRKTVDERLYERAIEEIVSLRMGADIEKATIEKAKKEKVIVAGEPTVSADKVIMYEGKYDINTCTEQDLKKVGCANTLAHNIMANRPYKKIEDLKTIPSMTRIAYQVLEKKLCCIPVSEPKKAREKARKVNVNTATVEEMMEVAGISKQCAQHIRAYRNKHGRFEKLEDLLKVERFGPICMKRYGPMLEV